MSDMDNIFHISVLGERLNNTDAEKKYIRRALATLFQKPEQGLLGAIEQIECTETVSSNLSGSECPILKEKSEKQLSCPLAFLCILPEKANYEFFEQHQKSINPDKGEFSTIWTSLTQVPLIIFAHAEPVKEIAPVLGKFKEATSSWQSVIWFDVSNPENNFKHITWPAEASYPEHFFLSTQGNSEETTSIPVSSFINAQLISLESELQIQIDSGNKTYLVIRLDAAWCGAVKKAPRFQRLGNASNTPDNDGESKRSQLVNRISEWKSEIDEIIIELEALTQADLHPDLFNILGLKEENDILGPKQDNNIKWLEQNSMVCLSATIKTWDGQKSYEMEHIRKQVSELSSPELFDQKMKLFALEGLGQLASAERIKLGEMPPPDLLATEKRIVAIAEQRLNRVLVALNKSLIEAITFGGVSAGIISRLGTEKEILDRRPERESRSKFAVLDRLTFDAKHKVSFTLGTEIQKKEKNESEDDLNARTELLDRIQKVMNGVCQGQSEILRAYTIQFLHPELIKNVRVSLGNSMAMPKLSVFEPQYSGFNEFDFDRVDRRFKWPKTQIILSPFNFKAYFTEGKKVFKVAGKMFSLFAIIYLAIKSQDKVPSKFLVKIEAIWEKEDGFLSRIWDMIYAVVTHPYFLPIIILILIFLALSVRTVFYQIRKKRAEKHDALTKSLNDAVTTVLKDGANAWRSYLEEQKQSYLNTLHAQIRQPISLPLRTAASAISERVAQVEFETKQTNEALKELANSDARQTKELKELRKELSSEVNSILKSSQLG